MQHLSAQDILAIMGSILGPLITLLGFMWHHFNGQFKEIKGEVNDIKGEVNDMRGEVNNMRGEVNNMRGEMNDMRGEMNDMRGEMKNMELRLVNKIDTSYKSLNEQISIDRERISRIEGYLALSPTTTPQTEKSEKKRVKAQA
jgi:chromosome segregation ATPase